MIWYVGVLLENQFVLYRCGYDIYAIELSYTSNRSR
jgi:hypothetical protein